ncbi:hypothetical protein RDABS01_011289 [Bienertia sinuspersici]
MAGTSSDAEAPEFVSVFLQDYCSQQLHIPSSFKNHLLSDVSRRMALIIRQGTDQEWKVELVKEDNEFYFKQGWTNFVQDNTLEDGEFMLFQYRGNSIFTVYIYGKHACVKESVVKGEKVVDVDLSDDEEEEEEDDDEDGIVMEKRSGPGRPVIEDTKSEAVKAAKFYMKTCHDYPSFRVPVGGSYNIPLCFVDKHMRRGSNCRNIDLQVMNKIWSVRMLVYRNQSLNCKLSKGIGTFMKDNNIQEGDVLVFELVKPDTFKVTIFSC